MSKHTCATFCSPVSHMPINTIVYPILSTFTHCILILSLFDFTKLEWIDRNLLRHHIFRISGFVWPLTSAVDLLSARFGLTEGESSSFGRGGKLWRAGFQQRRALWGQGKNTILCWKRHHNTDITHSYHQTCSHMHRGIMTCRFHRSDNGATLFVLWELL